MSRTNRGSKEVGYDYNSKRKGNKGYMCSPDYNAVGASMKQITTRRERCEFRSTFVIDLDDDLMNEIDEVELIRDEYSEFLMSECQ